MQQERQEYLAVWSLHATSGLQPGARIRPGGGSETFLGGTGEQVRGCETDKKCNILFWM
jgi:hypothetical protein